MNIDAVTATDLSSLIEGISDLGVCLTTPEKSIQFPGPLQLDPLLRDYAISLAKSFTELKLEDGTVSFQGNNWRGHLDSSVVDGTWIRFRKMRSSAPTLESLPTKLSEASQRFLLDQRHSTGGLILISGPTGSGKSTTAAATVVSRLIEFSGYAHTVEEPVEHPLNGWHGQGYCTQTQVRENGIGSWEKALQGVLRSQAVGTPSMLFIGEIREDGAAREALRAAGNGFLVITTSFASDVATAVQSFSDRIEKGQIEMFSQLLRGLLFQRLENKLLQVQLLEKTLVVQQRISQGNYSGINEEAQRQANARLYASTPTTIAAVSGGRTVTGSIGGFRLP
ncbi:type II/IV secretion system family protein [Delftia acidovorans]|uniref:ATPase, T2SS/T4P/T4SS family n=1 Tax=Delftia acidovorans TaxID=80866 RepID=UPI0005046644|nr:ATPase, T2SS/T4P/T4SS family [Delftia acidovorans]KFJ12923.1 type II/IV secretion system family protein [Delftia acidovorans]QQB53195.1 Flp pilus assembly complex ATPase component TadA [Delftia acidovorans]